MFGESSSNEITCTGAEVSLRQPAQVSVSPDASITPLSTVEQSRVPVTTTLRVLAVIDNDQVVVVDVSPLVSVYEWGIANEWPEKSVSDVAFHSPRMPESGVGSVSAVVPTSVPAVVSEPSMSVVNSLRHAAAPTAIAESGSKEAVGLRHRNVAVKRDAQVVELFFDSNTFEVVASKGAVHVQLRLVEQQGVHGRCGITPRAIVGERRPRRLAHTPLHHDVVIRRCKSHTASADGQRHAPGL
jgi:hypothetical protein